MAIERISPIEVKVGHYVYTFEEPDEADGFEACVAAVNARYCEQKHPCVSKKSLDARGHGSADNK